MFQYKPWRIIAKIPFTLCLTCCSDLLQFLLTYCVPSLPISFPPPLPPAYISKPQISFTFFKEGDSYYGNVTCWSTRGTPPANFSLSLDGHEVGYVTKTDSLVAWFHIAMLPGMDMGLAQCHVKSEIQEVMSEPVTLEVGMICTDACVLLWALITLFANYSLSSCVSSPSWRGCEGGGGVSVHRWI